MLTLTEGDAAAVAGIEKLRFFPLEVESGNGCILIEPAAAPCRTWPRTF